MSRLNYISSILGYKFYIGLTLLCVGLFYAWHVQKVNELTVRIEQETSNRIHLEYSKKLIKVQDSFIIKQNELQKEHNAIQSKKQASLNTINDMYINLATSVSNRPSRPSNNSTSTTATSDSKDRTEGTGRGLYREDATFLAGYARTTERLKVELIACYDQYDNAKAKLEQYQAEVSKVNSSK